MITRIPVSEARSNLSNLLKQLQEDPETIFEITVNDIVLGELRAPEATRFRIRPGNILVDALEAMGEPDYLDENISVAREHNDILYGNSSDLKNQTD